MAEACCDKASDFLRINKARITSTPTLAFAGGAVTVLDTLWCYNCGSSNNSFSSQKVNLDKASPSF
ncbi:hypothetical protein Mapa_014285 [Marchantia paleacea]|nr:hypothetical protein Mapa_014285 [Marchantia paleacea]